MTIIKTAALIEALAKSTAQLRDLNNDWPKGELFEPLTETIRRNLALLPPNIRKEIKD